MRYCPVEPRSWSWYVNFHSLLNCYLVRFLLIVSFNSSVCRPILSCLYWIHQVWAPTLYVLSILYVNSCHRSFWHCRFVKVLASVAWAIMGPHCCRSLTIWLIDESLLLLRTEQEGEAEWIFDSDEVNGNGIGASPRNDKTDRNVDLAQVYSSTTGDSTLICIMFIIISLSEILQNDQINYLTQTHQVLSKYFQFETSASNCFLHLLTGFTSCISVPTSWSTLRRCCGRWFRR